MTDGGCADFEVQLGAWIDGELDASAAARVREHVAACASCRRRHDVLVLVGRAVRSLPEETVPAGLQEAFRHRLAAARAGAGRRRALSPVLVAAAGVAAVIVLVLLGLPALRRASVPAEATATGPAAVPRWLAACGAATTAECQRETPCASPAACGVGARHAEAPARHAAVPAGAPCGSAATCGIVWLVPASSAGRFVEASGRVFGKPR